MFSGGVYLGKHTLQPASVRASPASECAQQAEASPVGKALRLCRQSETARSKDRAVSDSFQVNDDEIGKSESRENLSSDEGTFSQEYLVYCKKK